MSGNHNLKAAREDTVVPNESWDGKMIDIDKICYGVIVDSTSGNLEKKMPEKQVATQDFRLLSQAIKMSFDGIIIGTLEGHITYANDAVLAMIGTEDEKDLIGKNVLEFIAEKDRQRATENSLNCLKTGKGMTGEFTVLKKGGAEFKVEVTTAIIKDGEGKQIGFIDIVRDITEQKKTTEALIFQSQLLQAVGQPVIEIDNDRIIRYWNNGAMNLYGWTSEEVIGKNLDDVLNTGYSQSNINNIFNRLKSGESWSGEAQVKDRKGNTVNGIITRHPVSNQAGKLIGCISVYTDITEQKYLELELKRYVEEFAVAEDEIQKLNDKLRVIASLTRHDVRNKLGVINGYIYLLRKQISDNEVAMKHLAKMDEALEQLLAILEFERIYEQIGSEKLDFVNVGKFFSESSSLVTDFKGANIKCECDGLEVLADSLLRQLLYNLIDNTLKYGEKTTLIKLYYKRGGNYIHLIYEDDGVGMSDEVKAHLFEKGFGKGTGFGLYMIKRIIDTYGWSIEENGKLGVGAKFTIKIPANKFRIKY